MKEIILNLKLWTKLALLFLVFLLAAWGIKILKINHIDSSNLNYILRKSDHPITLDLWEAEYYDSAVVVQPLIGNLVFYSNHGRYEPRLAEKWIKESSYVWSFFLKKGMTCENGEKITASSFKKSLERSILASSKTGEPPVLKKLKGYSNFRTDKKDLAGIVVEDNKLSFVFDVPLRDGLVQTLSFAPYGYICEDNLNKDGTWKDKSKFISSGPYRISDIQIGSKYQLSLRPEWEMLAKPNAPRKINIHHEIPTNASPSENIIIDSYYQLPNTPEFVSKYKLVPEYLLSVLLGNLEKGYFSKKENRIAFKSLISKNREALLPETFGNQIRGDSFYAIGTKSHKKYSKEEIKGTINITPPTYTLVIEGVEPEEKSFKYPAWKVLKKSLEEARISYKFANNDPSWKNVRSQEYDLRMRGTSVGGAADAWEIDVLFCSIIGSNLPDPELNICRLISEYQNDKISDVEFQNSFLKLVDNDSAIVPISHFGNEMYLGPTIKANSISPALNVIRFDQLEMER